MFRWPGKIKPGQVSNEMVAHLDLLPTLLAIAGDTQRQKAASFNLDEVMKSLQEGAK
jgi:arylsulfatase A-like enzyme